MRICAKKDSQWLNNERNSRGKSSQKIVKCRSASLRKYWLKQLKIDTNIIDDLPSIIVTKPRLIFILVTHDIGVVRLLAHRLLVMKNGQIVEFGLTDRVLDDPQHPYTQQLVSSVLINN